MCQTIASHYPHILQRSTALVLRPQSCRNGDHCSNTDTPPTLPPLVLRRIRVDYMDPSAPTAVVKHAVHRVHRLLTYRRCDLQSSTSHTDVDALRTQFSGELDCVQPHWHDDPDHVRRPRASRGGI